jgi:hypothetical protein
MVTIIVLSVVFAILLSGFLSFYWYSRTPAWGDSETRKALLQVLVVVGPLFGMHYERPQPERQTIGTPKLPDDESDIAGIEMGSQDQSQP